MSHHPGRGGGHIINDMEYKQAQDREGSSNNFREKKCSSMYSLLSILFQFHRERRSFPWPLVEYNVIVFVNKITQLPPSHIVPEICSEWERFVSLGFNIPDDFQPGDGSSGCGRRHGWRRPQHFHPGSTFRPPTCHVMLPFNQRKGKQDIKSF